MSKYVGFFFTALFFLNRVFNANAEQATRGAAASDVGFTPQVSYLTSSAGTIKYLFVSFFYIFLFFMVLFVAWKYFLNRLPLGHGLEQFRVVRKLILEPGAALTLVEIGKKYYILGVGNKTIVKIDTIAKEDIADLLKKDFIQTPQPAFKDLLAKFLKEKK